MWRRMAAAIAVGVLAFGSDPPVRAGSPTPVLIELFTSEGCSSCPSADRFLATLAGSQPLAGVLVIALGHHVTYWDREGWRDRFSSEALTERQHAYGTALHVPNIYTPQMVADGRFQFSGNDTTAGRRAIDQAAAQPHGAVSVRAQAGEAGRVAVAVEASELPPLNRGDRADVVVAVTEDGLESSVRAGENKGRTLVHTAVVRRLSTIGEVKGTQASARTAIALDREWQRDRIKIVAFAQERSSRRVLGAAVTTIR